MLRALTSGGANCLFLPYFDGGANYRVRDVKVTLPITFIVAVPIGHVAKWPEQERLQTSVAAVSN